MMYLTRRTTYTTHYYTVLKILFLLRVWHFFHNIHANRVIKTVLKSIIPRFANRMIMDFSTVLIIRFATCGIMEYNNQKSTQNQ